MKKQRRIGVHRKTLDFLPDADEIEHRPLSGGIPVTLYLLVAFFITGAIWAGLSEVDEVVTARGRLVTPYPNIVVQPIETAQIKALHVQAGQIVRKGQLLATLDPTVVFADLKQLQDRYSSLDAQVRRLEAESAGSGFQANGGKDDALQASVDSERTANYKAKLAQQDQSIARLRASVVTNQQEVISLDARVRSLKEIEAMNENLSHQRFVSHKALLESREKRMEVERDLIVARNRGSELRHELSAAESERTAFVKEWRQKNLEELVDVRRERDAVAEQVQKVEMRSRLINLAAPEDAVVLEIAKRSVASIVREAEPLFTLVPLNAPLEAEAQIDARDIGYVKVGDPVRIKIDAFPFQKHGVMQGALAKLGQDSFVQEAANGQSRGAFYMGRVTLGPNTLAKGGQPTRLLPGMSLSVEIVVGRRTVLSYILYPIVRTLDEAAREP